MAHLSRRALVVGINSYTEGAACLAGCRRRWSDLLGAVRDAESMSELLIHSYGFAQEGVVLLRDDEATRAAILAGITTHLLAPARPGDDLVFFYAGHGSQVPNAASDEPDRLDESLVPADSNRGAEDIRDKELARLFNRILDTGARLTVVFDSCHSGSAARGLPGAARARFLRVSARGVNDGAPVGGRPEERGALVLSASQDFELARETPDETGHVRGAFTRALLVAAGRASPGEPAEETFLRARAVLQSREAPQEPVLAGTRERRWSPLFAGPAQGGRTPGAVAIRSVEPDGTVVLEGGWAHGLREGVELAVGAGDGGGVSARLRVARILGPSTAEAMQVEEVRRLGPPTIRAGDLAVILRWVVANEPSLRVWVPAAGPRWAGRLEWVRSLRKLAGERGVAWVTDPVESAPTHVLTWDADEGGWWLGGTAGEQSGLGSEPDARRLLASVQAESEHGALFVHLPASQELAAALSLGEGTDHDAVERVNDRARAHYFLVGRLAGDQVDYAWVRPGAGELDAASARLPPRSDWCGEARLECAAELTEKALRLAKIRAWLTLESPPGGEFPYELYLLPVSGEPLRGGTLREREVLGLFLRADPQQLAAAHTPRYLYFFTVDSHGNSALLFPAATQGSVENRYPMFPGGKEPAAERWPAEMHVGPQALFRISEPFGIDTFFLLSTEEPIPNPGVLNSPGVRSRGAKGATQLEELLLRTGSASRGARPVSVPVTWSLERLSFETVPGA